MLTEIELKVWLHAETLKSKTDKLLVILASYNDPVQVRDIKERAKDAGLREVLKWNVSLLLSRSKGMAINTSSGWELLESGKSHLLALGVDALPSSAKQTASDLRALLPDISDTTTKAFVEEAIRCYEQKLHRSAIVMSWLAAVDVLKKEVVANHLQDFNKEASRLNVKWRPAKTADDLGLMGEFDFLNRLSAISVLGKNVKDELLKCLKIRNGCGHPNSLKVGPNAVTHHIEILLLNVFQRFS